MQKRRVPRQVTKKIPPFHTFLVEQHIEVCEQMKVSLIGGTAQIYGVELKKNYPHYFAIPCSIPVFTWDGAQIKIEWTEYENTENSSAYWLDVTQQSNQTQSAPMIKYLEVHYNLLSLRKMALVQNKIGPKVAVVGTLQSASQNISKTLLNYSGKYSMNPVFIDLDPESSIFIDGSVGALEFEYKIAQDIFNRPNKICFYYGHRSTRSKTFLEQVSFIADCVNKKLNRQIKDYKLHGTKEEYPYFAAGLIIQCPRYRSSENKQNFLARIKQIVSIFDCTHVIYVGLPEIQSFFSQSKIKAQIIKGLPLQGTQSFLRLPRPIRSKIQRYFNNESIQIKCKIDEITIYQLMTEEKQKAHCRTIDIRNQAIAKNTVAILHANIVQSEKSDKFALYEKALFSPICCLIRISNIEANEITLQVGQEHFLEDFKDKIWVTSVNDQ